jgi:NAD/NADP transhydrogenase beta subunit
MICYDVIFNPLISFAQHLQSTIYSVLKASTGFIAMALLAGIKPANAPLIINMLNAFIATHKSTVGFKNISPSYT